MNDKMTKILLGTIALGLWANVTVAILRTPIANAQGNNPALQAIQVNLAGIYNGTCVNRKIC
jgi:hypothetical protein